MLKSKMLELKDTLLDAAWDNIKGLKRPLWFFKDALMPLPWVGGNHPANGEWARVDEDRAQLVEILHLCLVCGVELDWGNRVYGMVSGSAYDSAGFFGVPSATFAHPECLLKAATFCPHLKNVTWPAMLPDGTQLTHEELKTLVHERKNAEVKSS